ncbi:helix-turn-helix domain-containing protein [Nocardioides sp. AE5]|uniref:helix-turn-helix domain-containing protein n=1 Tax=Nocardioides sp. AE5 TaxID=2962573 RepID=UPI002882D0C9|nr:helix-turn-helix domain-containing protein [Nocardioides sp. AE5]MDT0203525.1 hypothetical protein [Nocardioides sp. AE5]
MNAATAVAEILDRTGETKASLSRRSGVSRSLIDDYLKGKRQPTVAQLERLGESVGLRLDLAWASPDNPGMRDEATTLEERAQLLGRVVPLGRALRREEAGELEFPPFRTLRRRT